MLRPSRPWRSPLQARDLRDETPWAAPPSSCLPCSLPSLPPCSHGAPRAVTATTPQSAWRQRGGRAYPPLLGGRSGNANSNAPERAQVQSDLASRRRNQAPSGDPFAPNCLKGQQFDSYWLPQALLENSPLCARPETRRYSRYLGEALWANAGPGAFAGRRERCG